MVREEGNFPLKKTTRVSTAIILIVAVVFLLYQISLIQNSFSALHNIALEATSRWQATGSSWHLVWLASETSGEIGLLLRFVGACFFVMTAWLFFRQQRVSYSNLRKGVFFEGTYFLFFIPFVVYLLAGPSRSLTRLEAGISYALQLLLVSPSLFMLYHKLKNPELERSRGNQVVKWSAIAFCCYVSALWVKHLLFAFYAVGVDFSTLLLTVGSLNSFVTLLLAAVGSLIVFLPIIRGKKISFSLKGLGAVLVCVGAYFVIFIIISSVNASYLNWLGLTEWWVTSVLVLGLAFIIQCERSLW